MKRNIAITCFVLLAGSFVLIYFTRVRPKVEVEGVIYISPELQLPDGELIEKYNPDAESGDFAANVIIYERLYLRRGDFDAAKPYLERAAAAGDDFARAVLKDPVATREAFLGGK